MEFFFSPPKFFFFCVCSFFPATEKQREKDAHAHIQNVTTALRRRRREIYTHMSSKNTTTTIPVADFDDDDDAKKEEEARREKEEEEAKVAFIARACRDATRFHLHHHHQQQNLVDATTTTTTTTSKPSEEEEEEQEEQEEQEERYYEPSREEIERALERSGKDAMSAMALVQRQMAIKIEQDELAKAMETSLKENEALARKRKREEEDKRDRDPVKAYGCATTMSEAALKRMFVDGNGRNKAKAMELCEFEKKAKRWYNSARETIEDVFEQIGASVENAQTEEDVGKILTNSMEMLREQTLKMPLKAGAVPQIFASEEALNGENRVEEVVELDSSSSEEEEEGEKG